ncbi:MAG: hypothetical protein CW342_14250 [Thermoactinomycetaceae bacterium]|nr:hypothetical protein [Thermoactinomycetaceae bacterium]
MRQTGFLRRARSVHRRMEPRAQFGADSTGKTGCDGSGGRAGHPRPQGRIHRIGPDEHGPAAPQDSKPPIEVGRDAVGALHPNPGHHRLYGRNCKQQRAGRGEAASGADRRRRSVGVGNYRGADRGQSVFALSPNPLYRTGRCGVRRFAVGADCHHYGRNSRCAGRPRQLSGVFAGHGGLLLASHLCHGGSVAPVPAVFFTLVAPSFYVATISFHPEAVPTEQLFTFASSRERIPMPTIVETVLMELAFEAVREAGLRLPKLVGSAVTIVGALIIGEAAVTAGIVSAPVVIVVALTGIASFTIPRYSLGFAMRVLRFPLLFISGGFGMVGFSLALIALVIHLASLRSFGMPYLSPIAPFRPKQMKDVFWRTFWWKMRTRPTESANTDRQAPDQKPGPERGGEQ